MADNETNRLSELKKQLAKSRALKAQGTTFEVNNDPLNSNQKVVTARQGGKVVGEMTLYPESDKTNFKGVREVRQIWTDPALQRQGVATSLFNEAKKLKLKPVHSSQLTAEGTGFSKAVSAPTAPPRPWQQMKAKEDAVAKKEIKQITKSAGKERAAEIAKLKAAGRMSEISTPALRRNVNIPSGPAIRPGVAFGGAANILSFLPMILEGGKIAQGTSSMLPRFDRVN
jgi:hypothetical protein